MRARTFVRSLFGSAILALAVLALGPTSVPVSARSAQQDTQAFDEAWRIVRDKFYDRNLKGLDWEAVGNRHRADYENAKTDAERSAAINAMLAELGASHTHHYTRDETAYYELADIFSYKLRREIPKYFSGDKVAYSGIGMFTKEIDGKTFISAVFPGLPADKAGLLLGDELVSADGAPFEPVASFRNKAGKTVALKVRRVANGPLIDVAVEPKQIEPAETFEDALKNSARIIEAERPPHRLRAHLVLRRQRLPEGARGGIERRQAQGRRCARVGFARRLGRRAAALPQRVQPVRADDDAHRPRRRSARRQLPLAEAGRAVDRQRHALRARRCSRTASRRTATAR